MGRALIVIVIVAAATPAAADGPAVDVALSCEAVVDPATVAVALRVELEHAGPETVYVDCPAGDAVVVAFGDRTTQVPIADVALTARARVVALAVAEQLRPPSAPASADATMEPGESPRPRGRARWSLGIRVDGVAARETGAAVASVVLARRWGRLVIEAGPGIIGGKNTAGPVVGVAGDLRLGLTVLRVGRTDVAFAGGLLYAATKTSTMTGWNTETALAGRGELRAEFDLGATRWRGLVALGAGRAYGGKDWFASVTLGAVLGL